MTKTPKIPLCKFFETADNCPNQDGSFEPSDICPIDGERCIEGLEEENYDPPTLYPTRAGHNQLWTNSFPEEKKKYGLSFVDELFQKQTVVSSSSSKTEVKE